MIRLGRVLLCARSSPHLDRLVHAGALSRSLIFHKQTYRTSTRPLLCQVTSTVTKTQEPPNEQDYILGDLTAAVNPNDILAAIEQHHLAMTKKHLLASFEILGGKVEQGAMEPQLITGSATFHKLANRTLKQVRSYDIGQCVTLLKAVALLKLPSTSSLVQGICQMIRASIKDLSLTQLIFLHFLLTRFSEQTILTGTLKAAVPLVFQLKCPTELDTSNSNECYRALQFALAGDCDKETLNFISAALQRHLDVLSTGDAVKLMAGVAFVKSNKLNKANPFESAAFKRLLQTCMDKVADDLHNLDEKNFRILLSTLSYTGFSKKLCDTLWKVAEENKWNIAQTTTLAFSTQQHRHFTVRNSQFLCDLIVQEKDQVINNEHLPLPVLSDAVAILAAHGRFQGLTSSSDEPSIEDALVQKAASVLADAKEKAIRLSGNQPSFITYLRDLVVTGTFPKTQLKALFSHDFLAIMLKNQFVNATALQRVLDIEQCVRLRLKKPLDVSFRVTPKQRFQIYREIKLIGIECEPLRDALVTAVRDSAFVAADVLTPVGTRADFLVVTRSNGDPVSVSHYMESERSQFFEQLPTDSKVAAIILTNSSSYLRASGLPTVDLSLRMELLRAQKLYPLEINVQNWLNLLEHERVPFIKRELERAFEDGPVFGA